MRCTVLWIALAALAVEAGAQPTYSKEVSRILQAKCQRCHQPEDVAPFSLLTYEHASTSAADIARVVEERIMPPWKPVAGHGEFRDNFGLTEEERLTILDWVRAGAPEGDSADLPEALPSSGGWHLGEPDLVVSMPEPFEVPRAKDTYRCFVLPTGLAEDRFVDAIQVKPGNRQVVHHVVLFLDSTGEAEKLDEAEEGPGYTCFGGPGLGVGSGGLRAALDLTSSLGGCGCPGRRRHACRKAWGSSCLARRRS